MMQTGPGMAGAGNVGVALGFAVVSMISMGIGLVGGIIFLVAVWRTMRAHESLAESARIATEIMERKRATGA